MSLLDILFGEDTPAAAAEPENGARREAERIAADAAMQGVPTRAAMEQLRADAMVLWEAEEYEAAAEGFAACAEKAHALAEVLARCLVPFAGRATDSREPEPGMTAAVRTIEAGRAEALERYRTAVLMQARCHMRAEHYDRALECYERRLGLCADRDSEALHECVEQIGRILGYGG